MPKKKKDLVSMGDKILYSGAGIASGMVAHRFAGAFRKEIETSIRKKVKRSKGKLGVVGPATIFLSMILPEDEVKYFMGGVGTGVTVDDVILRALETYKYNKIDVKDVGEWEYIKKFSSLLHVDPDLHLPDKEAIILPHFPAVIMEQRRNPLQTKAIERVIKETGINIKQPGLVDAYWIQKWWLYYGIYQAQEGLYPGQDRIRTLSKLLRVRDNGNLEKDGHPAYLFDCDDGAIGTGQILDYIGYPCKYILISQKPELVDGLHPLHHIFPGVKAGGKIWCVETIKSLPIVPVDYIHRIFNGIQRVVIINEGGSYYDYNLYKIEKLKEKIEELQ